MEGSRVSFPDSATSDIRKILREFKSIPNDHRTKIWEKVLHLPCNRETYLNLQTQKHSFEFKSTDKTLRRVVRNLLTQNPSLQQYKYLPCFIKRFAETFTGNELFCFEVVMTILINYCQGWFDEVEEVPGLLLSFLDVSLLKNEPSLYRHLVTNGIRMRHFAWKWMTNAYSKIVAEQEWPLLWDHIVCNEPSFFYFIPVAVCRLHCRQLLDCPSRESLMELLDNPLQFDYITILKETYKLFESTADDFHPREILRNFTALPTGVYPTICPTEKIKLNDGNGSSSLRCLLAEVKENSSRVYLTLQKGFNLRLQLLEAQR